MDIGVDVWNQDFDITHYEKNNENYFKETRSGKIRVASFYRFSKATGFFSQVSYKGNGYLLGNPLKEGWNVKLGVGLVF